MTPVQIAYFKHFLFDRGIQAIYISMYRRNRIKGGPEGDKSGNPESLEQFLQDAPYFIVIMKAFYFQPNSNFGYDYWKDINKKWIKYFDLNKDNPQNDKVVVLKGSFAILRQNWDKSQYWKTETMEATYARMHMEAPLKDVDLESAFSIPHSTCKKENLLGEVQHKFNVGDIIEGSISGEVLTVVDVKSDGYETNDDGFIDFDKEEYWTKIDEVASEEEEKIDTRDFSGVPEADSKNSNTGLLLEGFSLVETNNAHGGRRMNSNTVSVNLRNNGYRVTFASKQSDKLRKIGYKFVKLLTKKDTGEIALIFNNQSGCSVVVKKSVKSESRNVTINSKEIVEHICKFYNIKPSIDYFTLEITATIQQNLNTIFKLKLSE